MRRDQSASDEGHEKAARGGFALRVLFAFLAGGALALVIGWTASYAATTATTTPSTETVTSTHTVTSTTTTTATGPSKTTTVTETKTARAPAPTTSITNQTTTVQTAPTSQNANSSSDSVPTWAWVVMGLEALAIVVLGVLLVRERDLRRLAEHRLSELESYRTVPAARGQSTGYGSQGYESGGESQGGGAQGQDRPPSY